MASSSSSTWWLKAVLHIALLLSAISNVAGSCNPIVSFSISKWNPSSGITLSQDAQYGENGSFVNLVTDFTISTAAGAFRSIPVAFVDPCTKKPASFATSFTLAIQGPDPNNGSITGPADGMAFVIAPSDTVSGQRLGILPQDAQFFDPALKTVAVEIDTYQNDYDPPAPHVGLDVNSLISTATGDASAFVTEDPYAPQKVTFWVNYDARGQALTVSAAKTPALRSQAKLLFSYAPFDLSSFINPSSYVGFSASTGGGTELHFVYSWSFRTFF